MKKNLLILISLLVIFTACNYKSVDIITHFDINAFESYPVPLPGEVLQSGELQAAGKYYKNKDVKYLVYMDFYNNGKADLISEEDKIKEYQRLSSMGYALYETNAWTYKNKGEKSYYNAILFLLTEDEILNFKINENYGYFFQFLYNGDHSPQDFNKCKKVVSISDIN